MKVKSHVSQLRVESFHGMSMFCLYWISENRWRSNILSSKIKIKKTRLIEGVKLTRDFLRTNDKTISLNESQLNSLPLNPGKSGFYQQMSSSTTLTYARNW